MATTTFNASTPILSIKEIADLICAIGHEVTVLVQGDMGSGKTSLLKEVAARLKMRPVYFDCTTKDLGDLYLPDILRIDGQGEAVKFVPNEEFGVHHKEDIVLMLDELGKNRSILNGLLRVMQEHSVGATALTDPSVVFATTNLGAENVGDMLPPHARNRIMIVRMRKPDHEEWKQWAMQNDIDPALIVGVGEFPQMLQSFTDVSDPKENPYIYDPRDASRTSFVTPRSLEKFSKVLKKRDILGDHVVTQAGFGLVGAKATMDLMTLVNLGDTLPKYDAIVRDPFAVKLPESPAAQIMSSLTCMQRVTEGDFEKVFTYIKRMQLETQALFCNQLMKTQTKAPWVSRQSSFTEFARKNFALFTQ